ncbi:MAG TPA: terminase family protein [Allosphingosinicella sp.]|jgi:phage terminase large subunit-like protein
MKDKHGRSVAERIAGLAPERRRGLLRGFGPAEIETQRHHWATWARPAQRPPDGRWRTWLVMGGRGFGKTRTGAEWVRSFAMREPGARIALVGATMAEARAVMVEGESGLLAVSAPGERPVWEPSLGRLRWPNGAQAFLYSAAEPDSLRGPQHHIAWADEIGKWAHGQAAWDNLMLGLRRGDLPRAVATTTPRPTPLVRGLIAQTGVVVTRGCTADNASNLPAAFLAAMSETYGGTRLGRQELDGELIEDVEGSLWPRDLIETCRAAPPGVLRRVVIGVDPPASAGGDACGISVCALGADGIAYVLADASLERARPEAWARRVADAARAWGADRIVAEGNQGGAMVESVLRSVEAGLPVRIVHATHGKSARAEPVAGLFASGRAKFAGAFPELEDELAGLTIGGGYEGPGRSPDRADAMVWAMTELMLGRRRAEPRVRRL